MENKTSGLVDGGGFMIFHCHAQSNKLAVDVSNTEQQKQKIADLAT
jgi:hypothetical protein